MYPVRLYIYILPDAFCVLIAGSWSGLQTLMLGAFGSFLNVSKHAGFRSDKLRNRHTTK